MAFVLVFSLAVLLISLIGHFALGKESSLKQSLTSALGIIMLYAMGVVIYTFSPRDFSAYLNQLPIGTFLVNEEGQQILRLHSLRNLTLPELSYHMLRIFMLAVLVNLLGDITPKNMRKIGWILFRLFMLGCAIGLNYAVFKVIDMFAPSLLIKYGPMILLSILAFSFLLGFLKFFSAIVATVINPIFGAFHAFFFKSKSGKCMSRAIGSTVIVTFLLYIFGKLGYGDLPIHPGALSGYVPFTLSMFLLWLIVGRIL
jgi:hypothetical protein